MLLDEMFEQVPPVVLMISRKNGKLYTKTCTVVQTDQAKILPTPMFPISKERL